MESLTSLFLTDEPKLQHVDLKILKNENPVSWAANICMANAHAGLNLQAMKTALQGKGQDGEVVHIDARRPGVVNAVLQKIGNGKAGHASLQLLSYDSITQGCRFERGKQIYVEHFKDELEKTYPLGHYAKMSLWFSASDHVYEAHSDLSDGFLFQLAGKKTVRVWPLPQSFTDRVLYHHGDLEELQTLAAQEFVLEPGHVLFIPGGAAHEVTVESGYSSVSISFHVGGPYPLLSLLRELKSDSRFGDIKYSEELARTDKPNITFFRQLNSAENKLAGSMPSDLKNEICAAVQSDARSTKDLAERLDEWWSEKSRKSTYAGPYPGKEN